MAKWQSLFNSKVKMRHIVFLILFILIQSCSEESLKVGTKAQFVKEQIGIPDSIIEKESIPNIYTNKLIQIEVWYYGTDTSIVFANNEIQTIKINNL